MIYSITSEVQQKDNSRKYMLPGIHENAELMSIEFKTSEKGSEFIVFTFENAYGEKLAHTEWKTTPRKDVNQMTEEEKTVYTRMILQQLRRFNAIATKYITEDEFKKVEGNTFAEFCKRMIDAIGNKYQGVKLRIKVVYDKRNFIAFPSSTRYEWIENMSIPKENSKIKILPKDKMTRDLPEKLESGDTKENEILEGLKSISPAIPDRVSEDLPF